MAGLGDIVQKAFYLGVGLASYATEKAGYTLQELRVQAQKLADEMVARGEMTAEEARKYVDDLIGQAQPDRRQASQDRQSSEPRRIEIVDDEGESSSPESQDVEALRKKVEYLQEELHKLNRE